MSDENSPSTFSSSRIGLQARQAPAGVRHPPDIVPVISFPDWRVMREDISHFTILWKRKKIRCDNRQRERQQTILCTANLLTNPVVQLFLLLLARSLLAVPACVIIFHPHPLNLSHVSLIALLIASHSESPLSPCNPREQITRQDVIASDDPRGSGNREKALPSLGSIR
jgi:hypothetical protein